MAENSETNGTVTKSKSLLDKLHDEWVTAGSKKPDAKTRDRLLAEHKAATKKRQAAEEAFEAARQAEVDTVAAIVRARGKGRFKTPDGATYVAMSRGDTVYLRLESGGDIETF